MNTSQLSDADLIEAYKHANYMKNQANTAQMVSKVLTY